jgi:hypothetical protein
MDEISTSKEPETVKNFLNPLLIPYSKRFSKEKLKLKKTGKNKNLISKNSSSFIKK